MKPGNYTQLYVHLVFAVRRREAALNREIRGRVFEYISGIITGLKHKSIIVNGVSDHVHILIGLNPAVSISNSVHDIKRGSSLFINTEKLSRSKFSWQEGYGAFSYGRSQIDDVIHYINTQDEHHKKVTFRDEYLRLLEKFDVDYDVAYLFDWI